MAWFLRFVKTIILVCEGSENQQLALMTLTKGEDLQVGEWFFFPKDLLRYIRSSLSYNVCYGGIYQMLKRK